jgi:citrate lyase subunit beta/citryl-CoA lyase
MTNLPSPLQTLALPLFLPADRLDRFDKAVASNADAIILDLEDAVSPSARTGARDGLRRLASRIAAAPVPVLLRINAVGTNDHAEDLAVARDLPLAGIMLAKAERAEDVTTVGTACGREIVSLIETARGLAAARAIATGSARLAFGSLDFAVDLGCAHDRDVLAMARTELVMASRLAGIAAPLDGVTTAIDDAAEIEDDARYAARMGFGGKLLIHPAQIAPAAAGLSPDATEVAWARRILAAAIEAAAGSGALSVAGTMVDAPVLRRAERIIARHDAITR